jgi:hypothetical protein
MKYLLIILASFLLFSCDSTGINGTQSIDSASYKKGYEDAQNKFTKSIIAAQEELIKMQIKSISLKTSAKSGTYEHQKLMAQDVYNYQVFISDFFKNNP